MATEAEISAPDIPSVRDGVFFSLTGPLPRGRHELSREEVLFAQRERIMVAFTELIAARGYAPVTVADIVARAGVSREAFYDCFDDKDDCAIAGYDRFIEVLLTRVAEGLAASDDRTEWVASTIEAYLGTLQTDIVVAKAFQLEMDAAGAEARKRRREALGRFADVIDARYEAFRSLDPTLGHLPRSAHLASVYAVRQLACDALEDSESPDLIRLAPEMMQWISARDLGARFLDSA
jgi:AcrR family transcriptional regulator